MLGPRLAWVAESRLEAKSAEAVDSFPQVCPKFVIELMSLSYTLPELQEKMLAWISNGAELAWLIDPSRQVVEVYRPGREPEVLEGASMVYGEGPVAGFVLELERIWG